MEPLDGVQDPAEMANKILEMHNETVTETHLQWLARECSKLIRDRAEVARQRADLLKARERD